MKLHGGPLSPFARKVAISPAELNLLANVELVRSPTAMEVPNGKLMVDNPLSKIPTLVTDEGVAIFDSDVICEYLDATYAPGKLIPREGAARWSTLTSVALASGILDAAVLLRFARRIEGGQSAAAVASGLETKINAGLDRLEAQMPALLARPFDLSHITIGSLFGYLDFRFAELGWRSRRPAAADWNETFLRRPSATLTTPYEHNEANVARAAADGWAQWNEP